MARPAPTNITCPQCSQPFGAILEQILDTRADPTVKERLLSGRVNVIVCPHCGYRGMVGTPLMYHDHGKELAIVHVPMELNLPEQDREQIIGGMTQAVMRSLGEDDPKGYLLQPQMALTMQGLIDQVLEADGITKDMVDAERHKIELVNELSQADKETQDSLLAENEELIDATFFEVLTAVAQSAGQAGDSRASLRLFNLRKQLLETTEVGHEIQQRELALQEASQEIQALGENISREAFVDLLANAADNMNKIDAFGVLGRPLLDYQTFQLLTERIDNSQTNEEKNNLIKVRDRMLEMAAEFERQSRAVVERATDTLRMLLQAPDLQGSIYNNLERIDDTFLQVLQVNLDEARKAGNLEVSNRLRVIREEIMQLLNASAPPEIQFINALMEAETDEAAIALLQERQSEVTEELIGVMNELVEQLHQVGNEVAAARISTLIGAAKKLV